MHHESLLAFFSSPRTECDIMHLNNWAAEYIGTEESFSERANYDSSLAVLQQELGWDGLSIRRIKVFEIQLFEIEISKVYMYNNIAPEYQCQTQARTQAS